MTKRSWKTTATGIGAALIAIISCVVSAIDDNPETNPDYGATIAAIVAGIGLIAARDNSVTSEDVRAAEAAKTK